ncbi:tryptophan synthase beta subunit-like PLP-dependent enzyme [Cryphonectria parasitica EP155]|uniref:L-serine ammonia-lyase n=1 Tax=Cryphonectria parasitica (strain ATCC 38755 / EP155) TaxID=660469 RepID=A0A9P5CTQ9_CRYP1|nr:tryptophan synthase beta subunit-like PLP-dependent enzyme [Cryphonectria parasitica EP155]KAF3770899.1 tryptophan synthase beta subunit-like PLP-dependent enzyme [Cryphonectria parasitica EP155]
MGSAPKRPPKPWIETPCIFSAPLSRAAGCNIYLKLENLQPSGSFKSRGIGNLMFRAVKSTTSSSSSSLQDDDDDDDNAIHFYSSSGGNAGLACITAANTLGRPATVVVPLTTLPHMITKLRDLGADVVQTGATWAAADRHLREVVIPAFERDHPGARAVYVPPFDHQDIWDGVETMVDELRVQIIGEGEEGLGRTTIDGIVCNVGGGGLLCGTMQGVRKLAELGQGTPKVLAVETHGGDSLHASVKAGQLVTLPGITTIATSLGATRVAEEAFAWTKRAGDDLISAVVTDKASVEAMARFLDDARILVESACGATIATVYNGDLRRYLGKELLDDEWAAKNVVVIVCGGSNISLEMLEKYKAQFGVEA